MTFEDLKEAALRLDVLGRARLAQDLLTSLEELSEEERLALWDAEAKRREAEMDRDPSRLVDGETLRAEAFERISVR